MKISICSEEEMSILHFANKEDNFHISFKIYKNQLGNLLADALSAANAIVLSDKSLIVNTVESPTFIASHKWGSEVSIALSKSKKKDSYIILDIHDIRNIVKKIREIL